MTIIQPPAALLPWLQCETSLTEKLRHHMGAAAVQLLKQRWVKPGWWEKYYLKVCMHPIYQREVVIHCGPLSAWYARSHFPEVTYQRHPYFFAALQQQSLGALIFNRAHITKIRSHFYPVTQAQLECYWLREYMSEVSDVCNLVLWVRQATFCLGRKDFFYITEIFLPKFVEQLSCNLPLIGI